MARQSELPPREGNTGLPEVPYGTVIGRDYMIVRPLNKGSQAALYVVEQLSTASQRAMKLLRREYVSDETLYKRFEREAQVAAKIPSEHVVQVIAAGIDAKLNIPWISMELLEGQNLGDHVSEVGPLPKNAVLTILEQLCHAVAAAHSLGIVHRDLKPANVFLSNANRVGTKTTVKVLDFGVAKIIAESLTLSGVQLGTPAWMAPEQTRGDPAMPTTDVWALGLIAFYMFTGKPFWRATQGQGGLDQHMAVMREIGNDPIPIASIRALELGVPGKLPVGFDPWFAQCVARLQSDRFMNAGAAFRALANAIA